MRIKTESELLNPSVRSRVIQEIKETENQRRKHLAYKRYQCFKDKTKRYVVENMLSQFDLQTVLEMRYSISNISIAKKVIDKLARVYNNGVDRQILGDPDATSKLKKLENVLCINSQLKSTNRYLKLQKNIALYIKPCPSGDEKVSIKVLPLNPYLYDVIEDYYDRTKPMAYILSNYKPQNDIMLSLDGDFAGLTPRSITEGNGRDETIADQPIDETMGETETYIFWTKNHHFTTNGSGELVQSLNLTGGVNPFGDIPIINFAIDQDGSFWSQGGDDIIDGSVLINSMITHTNHVGVYQGYGQAFMTGENLPRNLKVGPTKVILGEYKKDEQPQPTFEIVANNPPISSLREMIEMYVALLLTTNNLSTSGISAQLSGVGSAASGIALIIDKAESLEDVQDQRQIFLDNEPKMWEMINRMLNFYGDNVVEGLRGLELPENFVQSLSVRFFDPVPIMSESEKLNNMKLRRELGIDSTLSLLMRDDPSLSFELAEAKMMTMLESQIKERMIEMQAKKKLGFKEDEEDVSDEDQGKEDV